MKFAYNPDDNNRIVWRNTNNDVRDHPNYPTVEIPDNEFPTAENIKKENLTTAVLDRMRDKFPNERTPPEGMPWDDDGLEDGKTRTEEYRWDETGEKVIIEVQVVDI